MKFKVLPRVFDANRVQTVKFFPSEKIKKTDKLSVCIQGMESYTVEHTPSYRIDEEDRYPLYELSEKDGYYYLDYAFSAEQRYSVTLFLNGERIPGRRYLYALETDLRRLKPFKGDTHLHTTGSDGKATPFDTTIAYRSAGFDFVAITDHHRMHPSIEARAQLEALTNLFTVIRAEEVHNKGMGYFHIINLGGEISVNEIIEAEDGYAEREVERILQSQHIPDGATPYICAYRTFVSNMIRKGGGLAVMAHPMWECFGEYNMPIVDAMHLLRSNCYDALELVAGCDLNGNGNNIQLAMWQELLLEGIRIPVVGCSDCHDTKDPTSLFNEQFTLVFAENIDGILDAIKKGSSVAIENKGESFRAYGNLRLVKYSRFLMDEYYPRIIGFAQRHADALKRGDLTAIKSAENDINLFNSDFFG